MFPTLSVTKSFGFDPSARNADWYDDNIAMTEILKHCAKLLEMVRNTPGQLNVNVIMNVHDDRS